MLLRPLTGARRGQPDTRWPALPYLLLAFILAGALFGLPVAGYLDPFEPISRSSIRRSVPPDRHHCAADQRQDLLESVASL